MSSQEPRGARGDEAALAVAQEIAAVPWDPERPGQYLANVQNAIRKVLERETERCARVVEDRATDMRGHTESWRKSGDEHLANTCANHAIILESAARAIREGVGSDGEA